MCTRMEILEVGADTIRAYIELNEFAACIIITKNITYFISLKANAYLYITIDTVLWFLGLGIVILLAYI